MVGLLGEQGHGPLCVDQVMSILLILVQQRSVMLQSFRALLLWLEAAGSIQPGDRGDLSVPHFTEADEWLPDLNLTEDSTELS